MSNYYQINARIDRENDGWTSTRHLATFFLSEDVQGIVDAEHAAKVARGILDPFSDHGDALHVDATAGDGMKREYAQYRLGYHEVPRVVQVNPAAKTRCGIPVEHVDPTPNNRDICAQCSRLRR